MFARWPGMIKTRADYSKALTLASGGWTTGTSTQTITSVDTTRAIVVPRSKHGGGAGGSQLEAALGLQLTNATTVTIYEGWGTSLSPATVTVHFSVIEFWEPPRSIQWVSGGASTRTITALNAYARALCLPCNCMVKGNAGGNKKAQITNATTVTLSANDATYDTPLRWVVVEMN